MRPGNTGLFNEHEVQHYYLDGTIINMPKTLSRGTPRTSSERHDHEIMFWYTGDYFNSEEYHAFIETPGSGTFEYANSRKWEAFQSDGTGINRSSTSQTALSWHNTYWTSDGRTNCTIIGSGSVYTSDGQLRYRASATCSGPRNIDNNGGSSSIDVPVFRIGDLGIIGESFEPNIPSAPAYFQNMYDVPETLGSDVFDRITVPRVNNIENLMGFKPKEVLPPFKDLIRKHNIKSVADFYLWYHYGASPTIGDIKTYVDYFRQIAQGVSDARNLQTINIKYGYTRYKIVMNSYDAGVLEALGLSPNLGNTWDCLPFSFILDWFVKVGDVLSSLDADNVVSQLRVHQVTTSYKRSGALMSEFIAGNLTYSYYERRLSSSIPQSVVRLHAGNPSRHLLDAGSLYFSGRK